MGKFIATLLASATVALAGVSSASAGTDWIMASGYAEANFLTKNIRVFMDDVKKASGGELNITLHSNGTLVKLDGIRRAVQKGQVQIGEIRLGVYSNEDPMYYLAALPFVAPDYDSAWKLMEAQAPYFDKLFAKTGLKVLAYQPWPGQGFYTKDPVKTTADFKGKKLRIYSKATQKMGEMLGFNATILPFAEIPQAFATGLIEALFTSPQTGIDIQAWDNTKYFTYAGAILSKNVIVVSKKAFNALPKKAQDALVAAGQRASKNAWKMSAATLESQMKMLADKGMVVGDAPTQVIDEMKNVGKTMLEQWRKEASPEGNKVIEKYLSTR
jgi:TRAP-type transport system periplasmic protein